MTHYTSVQAVDRFGNPYLDGDLSFAVVAMSPQTMHVTGKLSVSLPAASFLAPCSVAAQSHQRDTNRSVQSEKELDSNTSIRNPVCCMSR